MQLDLSRRSFPLPFRFQPRDARAPDELLREVTGQALPLSRPC